MEIPKYAVLSSQDAMPINYLCNIRDNKDYNIKYFEERKYIVIRNCEEMGDLCDLKLPKYQYFQKTPWALLAVRDFMEKVCFVKIFVYFVIVLNFTGRGLSGSHLSYMQ